MKKSQIKLISLACAVIMMLSCFTAGASADVICLHETEKTLVAEGDGYTVANVCALCGKKVTEEGYVNSGTALNFYSDSANTDAYTDAELAIGFSKASGSTLYTGSNIISSSGTPYWLTFDFKVNALPDIPEGNAQADLANADSRAYKGWSVVCMIISGSYIAPLRLIPDGWEADSGATGTTKGTTDGKAPIKYFGNVYREQDTVVDVKAGDSISFAIRVDPVSGAYDVYVDNIFAGSGKMTAKASGTNDHIRLWEGDGNNYGADLDFTNIKVFKDSYTAAVHTHEYTEIIEFYDEGVYKYESCYCGNRNELESEQITAVVADGLEHVYDGLGDFTVNADSYWFVTDVNIRGKISDGALLTFGTDTVLEVSDGKLVSGTSTIGAITYPTAYQAAVEITNNSYSLYINGIYAVSGTLTDAQNITCGSESFGHHVRFLYNKAVKLGETDTPVIPTYTTDPYVQRCDHSDDEITAARRTVRKGADGNMKYIYNCSKCGERVYSRLTGDLTNPHNDTVYKNKTNRMLRSDLASMTAEGQKILYVENNVIGKTASPYWISFSVTPNSIASPDTGDLGDPNTYIYRGYNMLSAEPSFYPASQLRIMPDGWENESGASGTAKGAADGIAEVKILEEPYWDNIGANTVFYRDTETVAYLEVGKTTDFALRIDPATGVYDVYVDGEYKASAKKLPVAEYFPQIVFHDANAGNYTYSNIKVSAEARDYSDTVSTMEIKATFTPDALAKSDSYTALAYIKRVGDSESRMLDLIYAENRNGKLAVKTSEGMKYLYTYKGDVITLGAESTEIAVIYDDINGYIRYYVNGNIPYLDGKLAVNVPVYDAEFAALKTKADIIRANPDIVDEIKTYAVHASGTSRVVGFQSNEITGEIRILSGLDMHWYGLVGYTVECYDTEGKLAGTETVQNNVIYSKVVANDKDVYATYYGFDYFSPLKVTGVNYYTYKGYSLIVTPFTKVGDVTYNGEKVRIIVKEDGYEFDADYRAE